MIIMTIFTITFSCGVKDQLLRNKHPFCSLLCFVMPTHVCGLIEESRSLISLSFFSRPPQRSQHQTNTWQSFKRLKVFSAQMKDWTWSKVCTLDTSMPSDEAEPRCLGEISFAHLVITVHTVQFWTLVCSCAHCTLLTGDFLSRVCNVPSEAPPGLIDHGIIVSQLCSNQTCCLVIRVGVSELQF